MQRRDVLKMAGGGVVGAVTPMAASALDARAPLL